MARKNAYEDEEISLEGNVSKRELVEYLKGLKVQREIIMNGMVHGTFSHWYTQGSIRSIDDLITYISHMPTYE